MNIDYVEGQDQTCCVPNNEDESMNTITEKELADNARNGAIAGIKAFKTQLGETEGWSVMINLTWKEGDLLLITQRKAPKSWLSHDRLLNHLQGLGLDISRTETVSRFSGNELTRAETKFIIKRGKTNAKPKPKPKLSKAS